MRNTSGIVVVLSLLGACGRTPVDVEAARDASRDETTRVSERCTDVCEQLACDPDLTFVSSSFTACARSCEADRKLAASVSPRCARAHDGFAECIVLADCDELPELEQEGGIATCRVQTDDVALHCPGVEFELAG
ncbi:MAG TPA: hypothetical protein VG755_16280 [Nannocystaceae bacterium]|nr:hypothetical protein [Nannocystaceae bacterium]